MEATAKMRTALKKDILKKIEADEAVIGLIAKRTNRSAQSVRLWLGANSEKLTTFDALSAIREGLSLAKSAELTEKIAA